MHLMDPVSPKRRRCTAFRAGAMLLAVALGGVLQGAPKAEAQTVRDIHADYDVLFNGVSIGSFQFRNEMSGERYSASSSADGRLLFGALQWTGAFSGAGRIVADQVYPGSFSQAFESRRRLAFNTKKRRKSAKLVFDRAGKATADLMPPLKTEDRVPLQAAHERDVFDPIAAIIAMTQTNVARPCTARLPVFEGRQRFDLVLKLKRRQTISDSNGGTHAGFVCDVQYVQIAGHRLKDENAAMTKPGAIELVLRKVDEADILVPHALQISTAMGSATLRARKIDIRTNGRGRIVLIN